MDGLKFDHLAKSLAESRSRRSVLKGIAAALIGGVVASVAELDDAAADGTCLESGASCREDGQCCSGNCVITKGWGGTKPTKRGRSKGSKVKRSGVCACTVDGDCPDAGPGPKCSMRGCVNGTCQTFQVCDKSKNQICVDDQCCTRDPISTVCQGRCGSVIDNCGRTVQCGSCCFNDGVSCAAAEECCTGVCENGACVGSKGDLGSRCRRPTDCAAGLICCGKGSAFTRTCRACCAHGDCAASTDECADSACINGQCGSIPKPDGTPTTAEAAGDCKAHVCDGQGNAVVRDDDTDRPFQANQCVIPTCEDGGPVETFAAAGSACGVDGGTVCDGAGNCVACTTDAHCAGAFAVGLCCGNVCVDGSTNSTCGNCGRTCAEGEQCLSGLRCCPAGQSLCDGFCCAGECANGICCSAGQTACNGACCDGTCCDGYCCPTSRTCCDGLYCCAGDCLSGDCCETRFCSGSTYCCPGWTEYDDVGDLCTCIPV